MNLSAARFTAALVVATAAVSVAACGEKVIEQDSLEEGVLSLAPDNVQAESASCPDEVSAEKGTEFDCTVTTTEGDVQVTAEVISEGEDDVEFEIKEAEPVD